MADFHLGFRIDEAGGEPSADPVSLASGDLTTHAVIVGMTGSGKTGLGIVLLEEALLAGVPCLVLDPKGDMGNLLLTFPDLAPASFRPWVNEEDARAEGLSLDDYAARVATSWKAGLAASGIGPERIAELREKAELLIYTPGSESGLPLNVIGSLAAPTLSWDTETETLRDEIEGTVTSLLGLVGIEADPLSSREHVLLSNLIENAWRAGRDLDLGALIGEIQAPPLRKLGVFDLETFFPQADRTTLALRLNGLVASPSFAAWGAGEPLDPAGLLRSPDGRPRAAIVSLAHLSDDERQFVVTLVLSKLVTWMRGQPGTSDLRTLVYMDEVIGFVPPTAVPPAKKPILTLLKQGRAFGVGMTLATQNPVDLDYKAMSNAGTWLVGRLQTERDKARVLEGLKSAAGSADVGALDAAIGGLAKRQFLLVSAKSAEPTLFQTRFAMSYLRGPLTRDQIHELMAADRPVAAQADEPLSQPAVEPDRPPQPAAAGEATPVAPPLAKGVTVGYLDPAADWAPAVGAVPGGTRLHAALAFRCSLRYDETRAGIDEVEEWEAVAPLDGGFTLASLVEVDYDDRDVRADPPPGAEYVLPAISLVEASFFRSAVDTLEAHLVDSRPLEVLRNAELKLWSRAGETPEQFAGRCTEAADARADAEMARIRDRLEARKERLEDALLAARSKVAEADAEARARSQQDVVVGAGDLLGAFLGGRRSSRSLSRLGQAMTGGSTATTRARKRAESAAAKAAETAGDLTELEQELAEEITAISGRWDAVAAAIETVPIRLERSDVRVADVRLLWIPSAG